MSLALLVSITTLGLPHAMGPDHDADCAIVIVAHDASAHQIHTNGPDDGEHPVHCLACHWARAFRPRTETVFLPVPASGTGVPLLVTAVAVASVTTAAQPPLRSPPAPRFTA